VNNSAYIRDIASLEQLRIAIARFCEESESQLLAIDSKLQSRIGNLKSLESQFQRMIESAQDNLRSASNALYSCEADTYEDEEGNTQYPDCDYEKEEVIECKQRLEIAEHNYNAFKREIRNLEISIAEYQNPKIKYRTLIQFEKEAATSSLKQLINGAEDYLSVSSPLSNGLMNGMGLADAIAKVDPTMILAITVGVAEIIVMSAFSFLGLGGSLFTISNKSKKGIITTRYVDNGTEHVCSELKIDKRESGNVGKILSVNIPSLLQNEKIGKHLVDNMEVTCRANDCKEISGWASTVNVGFYQGLGYQTRNNIKESGAEVFKPLERNFLSSQQQAKKAFENLNNASFIKNKKIGKLDVNPLNIISPDEMNDEKFWQHHGENQARYIDLIEKFEKCNHELEKGKTLDQIRSEDTWVANAYDVFHGSEPVKLIKSGDYYRIDSNGRHRVAAAQLYFLKTGKIIPFHADVIEKM
jgi:N-acetylglutamate synthase-like GNAT family acetyltransferase